MVPAYPDVAFFVEARTKAGIHIMRNKSAARAHKRAVGKFPAIFLVPKHDIGKTKNLVVKKIYSANKLPDVKEKAY